MAHKKRKDWRQWRTAVVEERPAESNRYYVVDNGGWLEHDGPYSYKELSLMHDAMTEQYGEKTASGGWWIVFAPQAETAPPPATPSTAERSEAS
jgi:hypothetical protein